MQLRGYNARMAKSTKKFTAVYQRCGKWYSAWIEEIPGVNTQGKTLREAKENLKDALAIALETNRLLSYGSSGDAAIREPLAVSV